MIDPNLPPQIFIIDGSVLRTYLRDDDSHLKQIFDMVEKMPEGLIHLFTAKSIIDNIKSEGNYPEEKMKEIIKHIKIIDVSEVVKGTDLEHAFRATEDMEKHE